MFHAALARTNNTQRRQHVNSTGPHTCDQAFVNIILSLLVDVIAALLKVYNYCLQKEAAL